MQRTAHIITVSNDKAAKRAPYIYAGFALNFRALYVGETRSSQGAVGRMAQHISETSSNTFKKRICTLLGYEEINLEGISFFAVPLSNYRGFWSDSSEYRRAVEFLVQNEMLNFLTKEEKNVLLVSRVNANGYCNTGIVKNEAKIVARSLIHSMKHVI
ncbi:MAG: hypothetical protein JKX85_08450 [Phycisphaeraceae bacterium]|nr:hypothetical protein [Phycisphaeraceae bacterium]